MTTDDLRTRAREAAEGHGGDWPLELDGEEYAAFIAGALWHAAQQPTREDIARAIAESDDQPDLTDSQAAHHYGHAADAVLALLDGGRS